MLSTSACSLQLPLTLVSRLDAAGGAEEELLAPKIPWEVAQWGLPCSVAILDPVPFWDTLAQGVRDM